MKVLVACEFSGRVRDAFRALGHDAISCDLLPTEVPGPHIQGDAVEAIERVQPDLLVAHPPCTFLTNSGVRWLYGGKGHEPDPLRWAEMRRAAKFFASFLTADVPHVAVENPVMHKYGREMIEAAARNLGIDFDRQTIQPYWFGEPESKTTVLWLRGLPLLTPTDMLDKPASGHWENQTASGQNKLGPSPDRWRERSRTYLGVAEAMAAQWGQVAAGQLAA